jgi:hypothetical protein
MSSPADAHSDADTGQEEEEEGQGGQGGGDMGATSRRSKTITQSSTSSSSDTTNVDELVNDISNIKLQDQQQQRSSSSTQRNKYFSSFDVTGVAELIQSGKIQNVIVMTGAGVGGSVAYSVLIHSRCYTHIRL